MVYLVRRKRKRKKSVPVNPLLPDKHRSTADNVRAEVSNDHHKVPENASNNVVVKGDVARSQVVVTAKAVANRIVKRHNRLVENKLQT